MPDPLAFFRQLLQQPTGVPIWVGLLMVVNMASLAFWQEPLARWILGVFLLSSLLMMVLHGIFGFQKILGLGHVLWVVLLPVVLTRLTVATDGFRNYLLAWSVVTAVSLLFDVRDVWQYARRERE